MGATALEKEEGATPGPSVPDRGPAPSVRWRGRWQSVLMPLLAIFTALALSSLFIIISDTEILDAWGDFFVSPRPALQLSGASLLRAYTALFQGSIGNPAEMVRGLGTRSTRHVMTRADLLVLEIMTHLAEGYRHRYLERRFPEEQGWLPGFEDQGPMVNNQCPMSNDATRAA